MRVIGHLADERLAAYFADWLAREGIAARCEPDAASGWRVVVDDDARAGDAMRWFARFLAEPGHARWRPAGAAAAATRRRLPWLTWALIATAIAITWITAFATDRHAFARFAISDLSTPAGLHDRTFADVRAGEVWRLLTPTFVHMGFAHLLFNAMWIRLLGRMVELREGPLRLAGLALVVAVASNVAQYLIVGPAFGGLSGLVYGLFGYVWLRGRLEPHLGWDLGRQNVAMMLVWFALCFTGAVGPIANAAHATGLGIGAGLGLAGGLAARRRRAAATAA